MRPITIGNLADLPDARESVVTHEWKEEPLACLTPSLGRVAANAHPSFDEGAGEPRPHRPHVICAIALGDAAVVAADVTRLEGRQRARAGDRPQVRLADIHHAA